MVRERDEIEKEMGRASDSAEIMCLRNLVKYRFVIQFEK